MNQIKPNIEDNVRRNGISTKIMVLFTLFFVLSICTIVSSLFTWIGFHIDITHIAPGDMVNYNPSMVAAFFLLATAIILLIVSSTLLLKICKMDLRDTNNVIFYVICIVALIIGIIAVGVNLYSIKVYKLQGILKIIFHWPYTLYLILSRPPALLGQLLLRYDFSHLLNIYYYLFLLTVLLTPGIAVLLSKIQEPQFSEKKVSNSLLFWLILTLLFPYLTLIISIKRIRTISRG